MQSLSCSLQHRQILLSSTRTRKCNSNVKRGWILDAWSLVSEWNAGFFINLRPSFQAYRSPYGIEATAYQAPILSACVEAVWSRKRPARTAGLKQSESEQVGVAQPSGGAIAVTLSVGCLGLLVLRHTGSQPGPVRCRRRKMSHTIFSPFCNIRFATSVLHKTDHTNESTAIHYRPHRLVRACVSFVRWFVHLGWRDKPWVAHLCRCSDSCGRARPNLPPPVASRPPSRLPDDRHCAGSYWGRTIPTHAVNQVVDVGWSGRSIVS
jgi:hypothetical protein